MENTFKGRGFFRRHRKHQNCAKRGFDGSHECRNSLIYADLNKEYTVRKIRSDDPKINDFLFTLGCYPGEVVTVVSKITNQYVIVIKDARYSIDQQLASRIVVE